MTTPAEAEDEWGELVDADFPRVDLVGKGANGVPRFLIAKQDSENAGLLEPGFVRDLIAKADPAPASDGEQVTVSGSPAAIAKLMSRGALSLATPADDVAKAKESTASINDLPDSAFAYIEPGGKKDADGKTTPRSLRHFPIHDKAHADNAAARIAQGAEFGDKAKAKVEAAQREFGEKVTKEAGVEPVSKDVSPDGEVAKAAGGNPDLDEGQDGLDPTVVLAAPDEDAPGDPAEPGSPAWEAIDAATASKWLTILSRTQVALTTLAERELLEAASADPDDCENAWDLEDACSAIDYAISVVAPYAVAEQCEADVAAEEMAGIAKAMATDFGGPLTVIEALTAVRKAGRVLSASNEAAIRSAAASLQQVLSTLPSAPIADDIAKEAAMAADTTATAPAAPEATETAPAAPETVTKAAEGTTTSTGPAPAEGATGAESAAPVAKADGEDAKVAAMMPVYDADGNLCGVVDPAQVTPLQGGKSKTAEPEPAADDGTGLTPAPPADAGTPADDVVKATAGAAATVSDAASTHPAPVAKQDTQASPASAGDQDVREVLKGIVREALDERAPAQEVAKGDLDAALAEIRKRLETVEAHPAAPKVLTNGAVPPAGSLRGQDRPDGQLPPVDVAKAAQMRADFRAADPAEQNRLASEMQAEAISRLNMIHGRR